MTQDNDKVVTLAFLFSEVEAKLLSDALNQEGIHSEVAGFLTGSFRAEAPGRVKVGSFRAEAPGRVKVLVHAKDLERARELMDDYTKSKEAIDWSQVDLAGDEDDAATDDGGDNTPTG